MTHVSPAAYCLWSVASTALWAFFLGHLWKFDRFKCLRWSSEPYAGAFKRFMTYTYFLTLPLISIYSYGFTYIKYKEGYSDIPGIGVVPTPHSLWPESYKVAVFPLQLVFSFAWSLEMVTHLEELCFWLFLMTAGPDQVNWFRSRYFYIWSGGSVVALVYMPLVSSLSRSMPLYGEANTFLAGSLGDSILTLAFIPVLWSFPAFLKRVKREGVDVEVIVRLRKFFELNVIRMIFRVFFVVSMLSLGIDGVRGHAHRLNEIPFWTDMFTIIAGIGCATSSALTLLIFFPRSYHDEHQAHEASHHLASPHTRHPVSIRHPAQRTASTLTSKVEAMHRDSGLGYDLVHTNAAEGGGRSASAVSLNGYRAYNVGDGEEHGVDRPMVPRGLARQKTYLLTDSTVRHSFASSVDTNAREEDITASQSQTRSPSYSPISSTSGSAVYDKRGVVGPRAAYVPGTRGSGGSLRYDASKENLGLGFPEVGNLSTQRLTPEMAEAQYHGHGHGRGWLGSAPLTSENLRWHDFETSFVNPIVYTFTSPIDLLEERDSYPSGGHVQQRQNKARA